MTLRVYRAGQVNVLSSRDRNPDRVVKDAPLEGVRLVVLRAVRVGTTLPWEFVHGVEMLAVFLEGMEVLRLTPRGLFSCGFQVSSSPAPLEEAPNRGIL